MKSAIWCGMVTLAFFVGWGLGRHGSESQQPEVPQVDKSQRSLQNSSRTGRDLVGRQWADKVRDRKAEEITDLFAAIAKEDRGMAMEAWFATWGAHGITSESSEKLEILLNAWAASDFEGARRWPKG